jgi:hypothetical protein
LTILMRALADTPVFCSLVLSFAILYILLEDEATVSDSYNGHINHKS